MDFAPEDASGENEVFGLLGGLIGLRVETLLQDWRTSWILAEF